MKVYERYRLKAGRSNPQSALVRRLIVRAGGLEACSASGFLLANSSRGMSLCNLLTDSPRLHHRHTSLVLFEMEVFYGQGISIISPPGTTHVS